MSDSRVIDAYTFEQVPPILLKDGPPPVIVVPEMEQDQTDRLEAARFVGRIASQSTIEVNKALSEAEPHTTLLEAMHQGNRDLVRANVETNMIEIAFKAGFVMDVTLEEDENGHTQQHGQSTKSVQANNLLHGVPKGPMYDRSQAETRNTFRFESAKRQGLLKDNWFVVISRTDTDMTIEELDEARFFTDTMSLSIQASTEQDGVITMESAFMAGVLNPGAERRDEDIVGAIGDALDGIDLRGLSATELIDTPILVPKSRMPNGTVDLVKMGDQPFGTFFGQDKPAQDYVIYREACREHRAMFAAKVDKVTDQLMGEAAVIKNEVTSMQRLHKLCGDEMVQQAIFDDWIDPGVFGPVSAPHIEEAREQFALGNHEAGLDAAQKAIETADPRSCPFLSKSNEKDTAEGDTEDGDCEYISKKCPVCGEKNVLTTVTKTHISGSCGCSVKK